MALQKQVMRMSVDGGLDTKTDSKNVIPTDYLELQNVRFSVTKAFSKRFGYDAYTNSVLGTDTKVSFGTALSTFNDELLRYDANDLYSYAKSEFKWVDKGITKFALSSEYSVASNGFKLLNPCHYTLSNLTLYAYEKNGVSSTDIEYRVIDNNTGSVLFTGTITNGTIPFVAGAYGTFFIFYYDAGTIKFRSVNFGNPSAISAATSLLAIPLAAYDVAQIGTRTYIAAPAATGLNVMWVNPDSTTAGPIAVPDASLHGRVAICAEGSNIRLMFGSTVLGPLKTVLYNANMTAPIHATLTLEALTTVTSISCIQNPSNAAQSQLYAAIAVSPYLLKQYVVGTAGTLISSKTVINQVSLQSKLQVMDGKVYFACSKSTSFLTAGPVYAPFRTYFVVSEDGNILNKYTLDAGVFRTGATLPNLNIEGTELCFAGAEAAGIQSNLSTPNVTVPTTIKKFCADFNSMNNYFDAQLGNNLHIAGGVLKMYDGDRVVEHNFLETPRSPEFLAEAGGALPNGTYQYVMVFKWTDKWGQVHRSAPSLPTTHVVSGGPKTPTFAIFTLTLTQKTNVILEMYRTEANGTVFYLHQYNYADVIKNDPTQEYTNFVDSMTDAQLIGNETLYTTGGVLNNAPCNSSKYIVSYKSRLFSLLSDGYTLQYTKRRDANEPADFTSEFQINLDAKGGPGVTLAVMDDNLIIFKEQALFGMNGNGPNDAGLDDDYRAPSLITSDCGCVDPNSVVVTPIGLMFKSSKGIYMLGRKLDVAYLGNPVAAYNDLTITSATLLPNTNEVRFTTNSELLIMYDYFNQKWAVDTNINAVDSVLFDGIYHYVRANGDLMQETPGLFSDNGSYISMKVTSAWMSLAGIQGFERFYEMMILGSYKSKHLLKVRLGFNFSPTWGEEATIDAGAIENPAYGDGFYGSDVEGGIFPLYQFRIFPSTQKCQSFRFTISDYKQDSNGESLMLSNFAAIMGIKQGNSKANADRSFGTK